MFILTIAGKEREGAYSVTDEEGDQILYLFEEEDDAERYAMQLHEQDEAEMAIIEVDGKVAIKTCKVYNYKYAVITPNDIVIPPRVNDNISEN